MQKTPIISLVVAIADNGVIGRAGTLPWHLSGDLKRFRKLTMGHPLIMGKNTLISIGKPLDGRDNIVVARLEPASSLSMSSAPNYQWAKSLEEALTVARSRAERRGVDEIFIIGGAKLFETSMPFANRIYLTRVHGQPEGDTFWEPALSPEWVEKSRIERPAGAGDEFPVTDLVLERVSA
ncbi:MAG: dihydrofolate reductase [Rhodomicrobium sp.]